MERSVFRAMGTEAELLLDAPSGPEAALALATARGKSSGSRLSSHASGPTPSSPS